MKFGVEEKTKSFQCIYSDWGFWHWCQQIFPCPPGHELWHFLCTCTAVFPPEDQSRWLWCHEMTSQWSLMLFWEGTIKGEHIQTSGLSSGFSDTEQLGSLTSHRPSTLAIPVPLVQQSITRRNRVLYLSICMYPDFLGNLLVSMTLVVWH